MARPERNNIDYFPHPCKHGKKMFYIRKTYGSVGYLTWMTILEKLGDKDYHYLDLQDEIELLYLSSECDIDKDTLIKIIEDLIFLNEFDKELWDREKILYNQKFVDNIQDAYKKRSNDCVNRDTLIELLLVNGRIKEPLSNPKPLKSIPKGSDNPQRIEEDRIEEKTILEENEKKFIDFIFEKFNLNEITNPDKLRQLGEFIEFMQNKGEENYKYFTRNCWFYFLYKELENEKIHNFKTFFGDLDQGLENGGWNFANWNEKYVKKRQEIEAQKIYKSNSSEIKVYENNKRNINEGSLKDIIQKKAK